MRGGERERERWRFEVDGGSRRRWTAPPVRSFQASASNAFRLPGWRGAGEGGRRAAQGGGAAGERGDRGGTDCGHRLGCQGEGRLTSGRSAGSTFERSSTGQGYDDVEIAEWRGKGEGGGGEPLGRAAAAPPSIQLQRRGSDSRGLQRGGQLDDRERGGGGSRKPQPRSLQPPLRCRPARAELSLPIPTSRRRGEGETETERASHPCPSVSKATAEAPRSRVRLSHPSRPLPVSPFSLACVSRSHSAQLRVVWWRWHGVVASAAKRWAAHLLSSEPCADRSSLS